MKIEGRDISWDDADLLPVSRLFIIPYDNAGYTVERRTGGTVIFGPIPYTQVNSVIAKAEKLCDAVVNNQGMVPMMAVRNELLREIDALKAEVHALANSK